MWTRQRAIRSLMSSWLAVATLAAAILAGLTSPTPTAAASGGENGSVDAIMDRILQRNPGLESFSAHARIDVKQVNFPYLHPVLDGMEYYKRPGFTVFDFPHTPGYLKGITKLQSAASSAIRWQRCYDISMSDQPGSYVLHMVPKIRGEVTSIDVTLSKPSADVRHIDWYYHNAGDHISLSQTYSTINGYSVVTGQQSEITLHHIRARGTSSFWDFQFNQPVPTPTPTPSEPLHQCDN